MVHSLAHIESWAVDLSWDIIARWSSPKYNMPEEFYGDFAQIADDEARHFEMLYGRLEELNSHYGAVPVHDSLWESAEETFHSLAARLAVEHCVHEGRGLDVTPATIRRFRNIGDTESADLLDVIYQEEIGHVTAGIKWFSYLCCNPGTGTGTGTGTEATESTPAEAKDPVEEFHRVVRANFRGFLKPPFNHDARTKAGMSAEWYEPLAGPPPQQNAKSQKTPTTAATT